MAEKRSGRAVRGPARVSLPLRQFLDRLHQCIGGAGPNWEPGSTECAAFRRDHPDHALETDDFRVEYLWANIMKKYDDGVKSPARRDQALKKLLEAEERCAIAPMRARHFRKTQGASPLSLDAVIHTASKKIASVLGPFDWREAAAGVGFGPGATTKLPRRKSDLWHKFGSVPEASTTCVPLVRIYLRYLAPSWRRSLIEQFGVAYTTCDSNTVTTVPKDSSTDRPIAIEPQWNMFFQKGIGSLLRARLKKVGVNLNDQTGNQRRALAGSRDGSNATIDLSSASDTVSRWLVHELLPLDWVTAMERCRSPYSVLPSGERKLLRKFSSMGNGYTFELESLIFWAIASSVVQTLNGRVQLKDHRVRVYGDDIIVPADCGAPLIEVLDTFGFIPNAEKSFVSGPFRESCGVHGFNGHDVTPFYIRQPISKLEDLFLLHNNLLRWSSKRFPGVRDNRVRDLASWVRSHAPVEWRRPRLCDGYGDGAFIGSFDECVPAKSTVLKPTIRRPKGQQEGWDVEVLVPDPYKFDARHAKRMRKRGKSVWYEDNPRLLRSLWQLESGRIQPSRRATRHWLPPQGRPDSPMYVVRDMGASKPAWVRVLQWDDMGPWVSFQVEMQSVNSSDQEPSDSAVEQGTGELLSIGHARP